MKAQASRIRAGSMGSSFHSRIPRPSAWQPAIRVRQSMSDMKDHWEYVREVAHAAKKLVKDGFLLEEDKDRLVEEAEVKGVELWKMP